MATQVNLLLVDDTPSNLVVLESILNEPDYHLTKAQSAEDALVALMHTEFALLILDVRMPGMDGIELAQAVKARKKTRDIPIIFLTAHTAEEQQVLSGYEAGAVDYVMKPVQTEILRSKVAVFVELHRKNVALREAITELNAEIAGRKVLEEALRRANDELEARVRERTADLERANAALKSEMVERRNAAVEIEKLAAFPRFNPNAVLEFKSSGELSYFNDAATQLARSLGFGRVDEMLPPGTAQIVAACLATGAPRRGLDTAYGSRTIAWSFFPIPTLSAVHCYGVEVSERLAMEAQLRQSQKMESIGRLAAGVAHDFNNMLAVIQGHAVLLSAEEHTPMVAEGLEAIANATERAANLTRQLLTFSRRQVFQPRVIDLNEVVTNMAKMMERMLGDDVTLDITYRSNLAPVLADQSMMEQILLNLVVNSRDAMPRGGSINISTGMASVAETAVPVHRPAASAYVSLCVRDNGCGIAPEHLPRIFEPFFTTKEVGKGTGLGLATVYGIIEQHQGWVDVESEVGGGTTFRIYLPAAVARSANRTSAAALPEVRGGGESILLVEDEPSLRELVQLVLRRSGYRVEAADSAVSALRTWAINGGRFDLLLTDMVMPGGLNGRELAERLLAEKPELKVIYSSGYSAEVASAGFELQEGVNFFQKPYESRKLLRAIRDLLDQRPTARVDNGRELSASE
jgi:two-component system, cell cycle sensor histidine kinase and response regulator CckA